MIVHQICLNMIKYVKLKALLLSAAILGYGIGVLAQGRQVSDYTKELNVKITDSDEKKMEKSIKILNEGDQQLSEAESMFSNLTELEKKEKVSDDYVKALKTLRDASETYKDGYNSLYEIFKENCDAFWTKMKKVQHFAAGVEKGKYYERQASKQKVMSQQRREQVLWTDKFSYARTKLKEANELDQLIIRDQGRAWQVFSDYPIEYNYGWEDDEEINEIYKNPAVNEPPDDIYATIDTTTKVDPNLKKDIIFKVQIAAHTVPITEEYLRSIYKGTMPIDMIYEDNWYKYSIGRYKTFDEADKTLQECNVRKAFIVAYQGGKKLTIQEAVDMLNK